MNDSSPYQTIRLVQRPEKQPEDFIVLKLNRFYTLITSEKNLYQAFVDHQG